MANKNNNKSLNISEIGTIRDILMGQQMAEYEEKFELLERRFHDFEEDSVGRLKTTVEKTEHKLSVLESEMNDRFGELQNTLLSKIEELQKELVNTNKSEKQKLGKMFAEIGAMLLKD